jgi:hypothetical protein
MSKPYALSSHDVSVELTLPDWADISAIRVCQQFNKMFAVRKFPVIISVFYLGNKSLKDKILREKPQYTLTNMIKNKY